MKGYKKYFFRTIRTRYPEAANHIISELDNHFAIISTHSNWHDSPRGKKMWFPI